MRSKLEHEEAELAVALTAQGHPIREVALRMTQLLGRKFSKSTIGRRLSYARQAGIAESPLRGHRKEVRSASATIEEISPGPQPDPADEDGMRDWLAGAWKAYRQLMYLSNSSEIPGRERVKAAELAGHMALDARELQMEADSLNPS